MNILYLSNINRSLPIELGVWKKVCAQCGEIRRNGHVVYQGNKDGDSYYTFSDDDGNTICSIDTTDTGYWNRNKTIYEKVLSFVDEKQIKVVYTRYADFTYSAYRFFKCLKSKGIIVITEIPTYPMRGQLLNGVHQSIKGKQYVAALKQLYRMTFGMTGVPFFKKCVDRIVNNNGFDFIWGVPVLKISNGVDVKSIPQRNHEYTNKKDIIIGSVANVAPWHGYDRVIQGLAEYYKNNPERKVIFYLAGPGKEVDLLKNKTKELGLSQYVEFLGVINGKELDAFFDKLDIGISLLGVHRSAGVRFDSLKSREYSARCLPFVTQNEEYIFKDKNFVQIVPSDESPLDIYSVLSFYDKIVKNPQTIGEIREFANKYCDWAYTFHSVIHFLDSINE